MLLVSENLICTVYIWVMHVKNQSVATAWDVSPKMEKAVSSTRRRLSLLNLLVRSLGNLVN